MYTFSYRRSFLFIMKSISLMAVAMFLIAQAAEVPVTTAIQKKLSALETAADGRIGIAALNTGNGSRIDYRAEERFPLCSTSKMMVAAAILKQSMSDTELLQQTISYQKADMTTGWSPITEQHIGEGMTIADLCGAAVSYSDNTAMNLLLNRLGGPIGVTAFARSIGDTTFRLDRYEPDLNEATPGSLRDTSTPSAMQDSLEKLVLGDSLALPQQTQLQTWLKANTTGDHRIRAGVPTTWVVGDKTGSGYYGTTNDIAVIWPPHCSPIVMAVYFTQNKKEAPPNDEIIAAATRLAIKEFAKTDECIEQELSK